MRDMQDAMVNKCEGKSLRVVTLLVKAKVAPHSKTFIGMILLNIYFVKKLTLYY